jgi:hypothetical protein
MLKKIINIILIIYMTKNLFLIIPIFYTDVDYRFNLFNQLLHNIPSFCKLIIIDSSPKFMQDKIIKLINKENILYEYLDQIHGKGGAIRKGIQLALNISSSQDIIGFQEPEKVNMLLKYNDLLKNIPLNSLCIPKRDSKSFMSSPKEQYHIEKFINYFMTQITGFDYDWTFGPILFHKNCAEYFLESNEKKWDSQIGPVIQISKTNINIIEIKVDFIYSKEQKNNEENNINYIEKRLQQANYWFSKYYNKK